MPKYHINKHGEPDTCDAKEGNCPLKNPDGTPQQHFDDPISASRNFETFQENPLGTSLSKKSIVIDNPEFSSTVGDYDIEFAEPPIVNSELSVDSKGFRWWRLNRQEEFFEDSRLSDENAHTGYKLPKHLNTLQESVSPEIIEKKLTDGTSEEGSIVLIRHNKQYWIMDGNHRIIASRHLNKKTFEGFVIDVSDDGESFEVVTPEEFNRSL